VKRDLDCLIEISVTDVRPHDSGVNGGEPGLALLSPYLTTNPVGEISSHMGMFMDVV
jgi:hypothetical protein